MVPRCVEHGAGSVTVWDVDGSRVSTLNQKGLCRIFAAPFIAVWFHPPNKIMTQPNLQVIAELLKKESTGQ